MWKHSPAYDLSFIPPCSGAFYKNVVKVSRCITMNQSKATFGFLDT